MYSLLSFTLLSRALSVSLAAAFTQTLYAMLVLVWSYKSLSAFLRSRYWGWRFAAEASRGGLSGPNRSSLVTSTTGLEDLLGWPDVRLTEWTDQCKDQNDTVKIKEGKATGVSPFLHFDV
jgi:hypothetical protein